MHSQDADRTVQLLERIEYRSSVYVSSICKTNSDVYYIVSSIDSVLQKPMGCQPATDSFTMSTTIVCPDNADASQYNTTPFGSFLSFLHHWVARGMPKFAILPLKCEISRPQHSSHFCARALQCSCLSQIGFSSLTESHGKLAKSPFWDAIRTERERERKERREREKKFSYFEQMFYLNLPTTYRRADKNRMQAITTLDGIRKPNCKKNCEKLVQVRCLSD